MSVRLDMIAIALRAGLIRGRIELRQTFTDAQAIWSYLFLPLVLTVTIFFMRGATVPGTDFSLGARTLPSVIGMGIAFGGLLTLASTLVIEREDGTLLRAKATPNGMLGYLIGKIVLVAGMILIGVFIQLLPGLAVSDELRLGNAHAWLTMLWVVPLGLIATLPLGAMFGSMISNPRGLGLIMLPLMGLVATSGIFYPIGDFPGWLRGLAQVFPMYWLGLGTRSAMLPADLAAVEIGGSWRPWETFGVLTAWAVAGLVLAPIVLRRMARRESGSSVARRREQAMQRVN